jgi:Rrf2 family nitric oxide-sensitive transcriptional repressor
VQLTIYSDYALRTLMYLGTHTDRPVSVSEVSAAYGISAHHVAKVAKALVRGGFARAHRGRSGGLELAKAPRDLTVGDVLRYTEPTLDLLECFDRTTSTCPLTGACRLQGALHDARRAFFAVLDRTTLADLVTGTPSLIKRLGASPRAATSRRPSSGAKRRTSSTR